MNSKLLTRLICPFLFLITLTSTTSPAIASLAGDTKRFAGEYVTELLIAITLLGVLGGCITWALSSNDQGKEWAKKSIIACALGLSATGLIDTMRSYFG